MIKESMWSLKVSLLSLLLGFVMISSSSVYSVDAAFFESSSSSKSTTGSTTSTTGNSTKKSGNGTGGAFFIKQGNKYTVTSRAALDLHETLPVATYTVGVNPITGEYYLQTIDPFDICDDEDDDKKVDQFGSTTCTKIYGDTKKLANRILRTYLDRGDTKSTGVLLAGEKGSGKTFLAKYISTVASKKHNIPTVVINQPLHGERFNAFIQSIQQPVIFLFDEFEKI